MILKRLKVVENYWYVYGALALLVLAPLLIPGYVMTVDMAWGPIIPQVSGTNNTWLLIEVLQLLSMLLGSWVVQKIVLLTIFVLAGIGAHKFALLSRQVIENPSAAYCAGVLYVCNPFVYSRLMQGQWLVLLGYALLPWALRGIWLAVTQPRLKTVGSAALWVASIGLVSLHAVGFVFASCLAMAVVTCVKHRTNTSRVLGSLASIAAIFVIINAFWLVPAVLGRSQIGSDVGTFGIAQLDAFGTKGTLYDSVPLSALLLTGFWADPQFRYILPSDVVTWWPAVVLLTALVMAGAIRVVRSRDGLGIALILLGVAAWWLSMGVTWRWSAPTTEWLINNVPFYRGYREPQKWLMLSAITYAYCAAIGTAYISNKISSIIKSQSKVAMSIGSMRELRSYMIAISATIPLLLVPILIWGASGQLRSSYYPVGWKQVSNRLNSSAQVSPVVVFPWNMYLRLGFVAPRDATGSQGRIVANPAQHYFAQDVITGNDAGLRGVPPFDATPLQKVIRTTMVPSTNKEITISNAGSILSSYGVKYVILYKESSWKSYEWLNSQTDVKKIVDNADIIMYEINSPDAM